MHPTKESSDSSLERTVSTDARRPVDDSEGEGGEKCEHPSTDLRARDIADGALPSVAILTPFQESAAKLQALSLGPGKTNSIATSLVAPSSSESDPPAVSITSSMVPPTGTPVLETRNSNRGPLPPSSDWMMDTRQSGPPLPGRYVLP
jgi:hypothetical protein